jgi:hypothetical protein
VTVQKFRSIEDMSAAPALATANDGFNRFVRLCARYWTISPRTFPRGVFKFRSIEEAQAAHDSLQSTHAGNARTRLTDDAAEPHCPGTANCEL